MAVTLEEVAGFLKDNEFNFEHLKEEDLITTGVENDGEVAGIIIKNIEDGSIFRLEMNPINIEDKEVLKIPADNKFIELILQQMLYANYATKFGNWEYDPSDGEVRFTIEIPLEDASMTSKQFGRILSGVFSALEHQKKFKYILETGEIPEEQDETIAKLQALLTALKNDTTSSEDEI